MQGYELSFRDYFRILKKHKIIVILITFLSGSLTYGLTYFYKTIPLYRASVSIKISTQEGGQNYLTGSQQQSYDPIETHLVMLKSFNLAVLVAKELGDIPAETSEDKVKLTPQLLNKVLSLQGSIEVLQEPNAFVIEIAVEDENPDYAQQVANAFAVTYKKMQYSEKTKKTRDMREFVEQQLKLAEGKLRDAEESLRKYSEVTNIVDFSLQEESLLRQINEVDTRVEKINSDIKETGYIIDYLKKNKTLPTKTSTELILVSSSPNFAQLNTSLVEMNMKKANMLLSYKSDYPPIIALNQKIYSTVDKMTKELKAQILRMREESKTIAEKKKELQEKYKKLPESKLEQARLQREVDAQSSLFNQLQVHLQEARIKEAEKHEEISIIKPALRPTDPVNLTSPLRKILLGILLGFFVGVIFAVIYENLDTSFETIEEVSAYVESPILGVIPFVDFQNLKDKHLFDLPDIKEKNLRDYASMLVHYAPKSPIAEAYRIFRTTLDYILEKQNIRSILITASSLEEGKSLTSTNLALSFAQLGKKTLLVDTDLRKPSIHPSLGLNRSPGFSDVILQNSDLKDATNNVIDLMMGKLDIRNILRIPGIDCLDIITCGTSPKNPSELLNAPETKTFTEKLKLIYDIIIFDTSPILPVTDASILSALVDGVILVYRSGEVPRKALKRATVILNAVNANLLGILINGIKADISSDVDYLKYSSYYYATDEIAKVKKGILPGLRKG